MIIRRICELVASPKVTRKMWGTSETRDISRKWRQQGHLPWVSVKWSTSSFRLILSRSIFIRWVPPHARWYSCRSKTTRWLETKAVIRVNREAPALKSLPLVPRCTKNDRSIMGFCGAHMTMQPFWSEGVMSARPSPFKTGWSVQLPSLRTRRISLTWALSLGETPKLATQLWLRLERLLRTWRESCPLYSTTLT